jgi:hypothetical protein
MSCPALANEMLNYTKPLHSYGYKHAPLQLISIQKGISESIDVAKTDVDLWAL